jgi:hypothetical protein
MQQFKDALRVRILKQTVASCYPNRSVDDGFGRKPMKVVSLDPKYIARQIERAYLTTAVEKQFVAANSAFSDLIDVFGSFSIPKDLRPL